jgi:hypothetical protein
LTSTHNQVDCLRQQADVTRNKILKTNLFQLAFSLAGPGPTGACAPVERAVPQLCPSGKDTEEKKKINSVVILHVPQ